MQTVEDLIDKLDKLPELVKNSGENYIEDNEPDILDMNKNQMLSGVDSFGHQLGEYAPLSKEIRAEKGLQTDHIDLRFTGEFHNSMLIQKVQKGFELGATDGKWAGNTLDRSLSEQFPDALGLTNENEEVLTDKIISKINEEVNNFL